MDILLGQIDANEVNWEVIGLVASIAVNIGLLFWKSHAGSQKDRNNRQDEDVKNLEQRQRLEIEKLEREIKNINSNINSKLSDIIDGISDLKKAQAVDSQKTEEAFNRISSLIRDLDILEDKVVDLKERMSVLEQKTG